MRGADERRTYFAEFAGVGRDDDLLGLLEHLADHQRFVGFKRGRASLRLQAGDAQEDLVHIYVVEEVECGAAGERKRPCPRNHAAGEKRTNAGLVAEFHADVDGVCDDLNLVAMAKAAADVRSGGAGGEANRLIGLHQFSGGQADSPLLLSEALLAREERAVVAERLVKQRLNQRGSAVSSANEAAVFKARQVATDAGRRGAGDGENLFDGCAAAAQQELDDDLSAAIDGFRHTARF